VITDQSFINATLINDNTALNLLATQLCEINPIRFFYFFFIFLLISDQIHKMFLIIC